MSYCMPCSDTPAHTMRGRILHCRILVSWSALPTCLGHAGQSSVSAAGSPASSPGHAAQPSHQDPAKQPRSRRQQKPSAEDQHYQLQPGSPAPHSHAHTSSPAQQPKSRRRGQPAAASKPPQAQEQLAGEAEQHQQLPGRPRAAVRVRTGHQQYQPPTAPTAQSRQVLPL